MKKLILTLLAAVAVCHAGAQETTLKSSQLQNLTFNYVKPNVDVKLSYPQAIFEGETPIDDSINRTIYQTLGFFSFAPSKIAVTDRSSLEKMVAESVTFLGKRGTGGRQEAIPYSLYSTWQAFSTPEIMSVFIKQYCYSGGAHGMTEGMYLNFDVSTGRLFDLRAELGEDSTKFLGAAIKIFVKENGFSLKSTKAQTGLFYEIADIPLPKQMGFNDKGWVLYYNQYEIAPYSYGPIVIIVPYKLFPPELAVKFIKTNIKSGDNKSYNFDVQKDMQTNAAAPYKRSHKRR